MMVYENITTSHVKEYLNIHKFQGDISFQEFISDIIMPPIRKSKDCLKFCL